MDYPFHFNLSGETMALKPMWLCGLWLGGCIKGWLWRGFSSV